MICELRTGMKIIFFVIISGATLNVTQAIKKSTGEGLSPSPIEYGDDDYPPNYDCMESMAAECKFEVVNAICQKLEDPVTVSFNCCADLYVNYGEECCPHLPGDPNEDCVVDILVKDPQVLDHCKKGPGELKPRAARVWEVCQTIY